MSNPCELLAPSLNLLPETVRSIHLLGIGGTAMAALAGMLKERGYHVTGSDNPIYPPMSEFLARLGINNFSGYRAENLDYRPDLVIVGNVISKDNPEAQALAEMNIPYLSMPQILGHLFLSKHRSLVVAGTHGKTTTSSLLAASLATIGGDPSFMIGGIVKDFNANYRLGNGPFFVIEGDEYDTAFFDKGSKFLHYRPEIAVITSIEFDHADIFDSLAAIKRSFQRFISLLPAHGLLVACIDDPTVVAVTRDAPCPVIGYGLSQIADWRVGEIQYHGSRTTFELAYHGTNFGEIEIGLPGTHNCLNAAAVVAILHHLGYNREDIFTGLASFQGVKRRQEVRGTEGGVTIIDDFAHHPSAVRETLRALKSSYSGRRLVAVFEPRSNTSRRSLFQQQYVDCFDSADISIIKEPPLLKQTDRIDRLSAQQLAADMCRRGNDARACPTTEAIIAIIEEEARPGDVIAILSNGGFDNIHERLLASLRTMHDTISRRGKSVPL